MHVCLIAEGSYPYVTGGVGKWTHDLIGALPDVEFTVIALWPTDDPEPEPRYPTPANVRELRTSFVLTPHEAQPKTAKDQFPRIEEFHHAIKKGDVCPFAKIDARLSPELLRKEPAAWKLITKLYQDYAPPGTSFPDYFWTWQATHLPLFNVLTAPLCDADVVHAISTGYAGGLAALHKAQLRIPLLTTEHGLYTRERAQEIWDAEWIPGEEEADARRSGNFFKGWWNRMFQSLEKITYGYSDAVVSLFEANRKYQIGRGAPAERTLVIPNGIDLALYESTRRKRRPSGKYHIGLVGRVVPIKDIKTFLNACKIVADRLGPSRVEISVIGPVDEDPAYAAQCAEMIRAFGLESVVRLVGKTDPRPYYETLDVTVLTSLSEGQPMVVLESLACGIPVVSTDVGSCRELLQGRPGEDRNLGDAGLITGLADPEATAHALLELEDDPDRRASMGRIGRRRVEQSYRLDQVRDAYRDLYRRLSDGRH
jgi:glycosyltransferase involved in cell wall biosynthesis